MGPAAHSVDLITRSWSVVNDSNTTTRRQRQEYTVECRSAQAWSSALQVVAARLVGQVGFMAGGRSERGSGHREVPIAGGHRSRPAGEQAEVLTSDPVLSASGCGGAPFSPQARPYSQYCGQYCGQVGIIDCSPCLTGTRRTLFCGRWRQLYKTSTLRRVALGGGVVAVWLAVSPGTESTAAAR
jgi:hypothetical protein